ncbi:cyclin-dependent kinase inhibitor 3-like [Hibiscus syriacus]|nr:cyclin-dependent kinase inhibitor 3-like [Hibiscus syriacus]
MKKSKITGDIVVMEVSRQPTMGTRTRAAKTLALQRLSKTAPSGSPAHGVGLNPDVSSFSYLQLRSRRLEKTASPVSNKTKQRQEGKESGFGEGERKKESEGCFGNSEIVVGVGNCCGTTEETCFREHRDRSTRESSSCSLLNDFETVAAPGSTTKPRSSLSTHRKGPGNNAQTFIPTAQEVEEFFVCTEQQQQRQFIEKYNFDIANDLPLPGRYEWVKIIQ